MIKRTVYAIVGALGFLVALFWFLFGTLSPCDALRGEYRRQGEKEAGLIGKAVLGVAADINTDDMTPIECTQRVVRLRFKGRDALIDLLK